MRTRRQFLYLSMTAFAASMADRYLPKTSTRTTDLSQIAAGGAESGAFAFDLQLVSPVKATAPFIPPTMTATATVPTELPPPVFQPTPGDLANYAPMIQHNPQATPIVLPTPSEVPDGDMPILGPASGSAEQAIAWFSRYAIGNSAYDAAAISSIVYSYQYLGDLAGMDWFLAMAQMGHEADQMRSWWSQPPRNNPAGIGVTGATKQGEPSNPPGAGWFWDERTNIWREGWAFDTWENHSIPAHLGRLLAYALTDAQANEMQRALIDYALSWRPLPSSFRGIAPTITGLNGRWAVPGTTYGQRIIDLLLRMRA
jgi:hypothetical protein